MWTRSPLKQTASFVTGPFRLVGLSKALLVVGLLFAVACNVRNATKYPGEWRELNKEHTTLIISKTGDTYVVKVLSVGAFSGNYDQVAQYPATLRDGQLKVAGPMGEIVLAYVEATDHILFAGEEYERSGK